MAERKKISRIKNGTVIDHIKAGKAVKVLDALKVKGGATVSLAMNVPSRKMRKKDILKVENRYLRPETVKKKLRRISPEATVNWIKNSKVVKKVRLAAAM
jgi:aspartate carbamoyltransferase regulatory subunit